MKSLRDAHACPLALRRRFESLCSLPMQAAFYHPSPERASVLYGNRSGTQTPTRKNALVTGKNGATAFTDWYLNTEGTGVTKLLEIEPRLSPIVSQPRLRDFNASRLKWGHGFH